MAITLDTTVSGENANSYITLAEADAYLEAYEAFFTVWSALTDAQKNARIVAATRGIDSYRDRFKGQIYDQDQSLEFPRTTLDYRTDTYTEIPQAVKDATCEMLVMLYYKEPSSDVVVDKSIKSVNIHNKVGVVFDDYQKTVQSENIIRGSQDRIEVLLKFWLKGGRNSIEIIK